MFKGWGRQSAAIAAAGVATVAMLGGGTANAALPSGSCDAVTTNIVQNCDFDTFTGFPPAHWQIVQPPYQSFWFATGGHTAGWYNFESSEPGNTVGQQLATQPNTTYQASFWLRSGASADTTVTVTNTRLPDGTTGTTTLVSTGPLSDTWTQYSGTFTTTAAPSPAPLFGVLIDNDRSIDVDDTVITPLATPSQLSPITSRNLLTVTSKVTEASNGQPVPAGGTVNFTTAGTAYCTATTDSSGVATCTVPRPRQATAIKALARARGSVTATYAGDSTHDPATRTDVLRG